jgi:type I pantothenate kinase
MALQDSDLSLAAYSIFNRQQWAALRENARLTLSDEDLNALRGLNERLSLEEVTQAYLPLSRLLNLHVAAARNLGRVKDAFLGREAETPPYVIAVAGSVAVGKSTFARVLQALLARWPGKPKVELITTDGFLHPNRILEERGLMHRKGFPESYDLRQMVQFLARLKAGEEELAAPVYSHLAYDIVPGKFQMVRRPDVLIFEGLNVLQVGSSIQGRPPPVVVSDYFDFSVYLDAEESHIELWYIERFLSLQRTAFQNPNSYFSHYRDLAPDEARAQAQQIWREINGINLRENIAPTRERADLVLRKDRDHGVAEIWLRRI